VPHDRVPVWPVDWLGGARYRGRPMSQRTQKKKANARRKKANHGRKPNLGRNS
jgi:hypothetical protein